MRSLEIVLALVLGASLVAALAGRLRAPAPSLLVVAGLLVALLPGVPVPELTPDLVLLVVLPPLLSSAAQEQNLRSLRRDAGALAWLAVGLVLVTAVAVAAVAQPLLGLPWRTALVLGSILASTDPVAVTALARRMRLPRRLDAIVQAESLLNDATSLVLFGLAVGSSAGAGGISLQLLRLAGAGAAIGAAVAVVTGLARRRTTDPVVHAVIAFVTPYAAYVAADAAGAAGVTSVVAAGIVTARLVVPEPAARLQTHAVADLAVFVLESAVFALIGLQLPHLVRAVGGVSWLLYAVVLAGTALAVRLLGVLPVARGLRPAAVMTWAGARGVVPIAAALSLPLGLAGRSELLLVTATVSVLSLVVQGLTLAPLAARTGVVEPPTDAYAAVLGTVQQAARDRLAELESAEAAAPAVLTAVEEHLQRRENSAAGEAFAADVRAVRADLLRRERETLAGLHRAGEVRHDVWRELSRSLDRQLEELTRDIS